MGYYDLAGEYVSNSDLNELRSAIWAKEKMPGLQGVYNFGNLVDSTITEPDKLKGNILTLEAGGEEVVFEPEDIKKAELMKDAYFSNPSLNFVFNGAIAQYVFLRKAFEITHAGHTFTLPVRCKLDLLRKKIIGGDIKSTACTSEAMFRDAIEFFNYDQQAAWYMDIAPLQRFMIIGIGKKPGRRGKHPVFTHLINKGDELYEQGKRKYSSLAFKYKYLISNFNFNEKE